MVRLESTILKNLIYNENYMRKVLPFLRADYFKEPTEQLLFKEVSAFVDKYKNPPTHEALIINLTESHSLKEEQIRDGIELLKQVHSGRSEPTDIPWLNDQTEKFCKDAALYNAVLEAVAALDETKAGTGKTSKEGIPDLLIKALGVSFDPSVGHNYLLDSDRRFEYYHKKDNKIPFDLEFFNKITNGGFSDKTLNIWLAGTGVGKTLLMCHCAASQLLLGYNVLYITMEMAEEQIAKRIDANLLNVDLNLLQQITKPEYDAKFAALRSRAHGKLIIKEYPTASASTLHFRSLLNELALKKSFKPHIIFIDYLNICASSRIRMGGNVNSYTYVKAIAEELRGLGQSEVVPIVSATQTTRAGFGNSDLELTDTSESWGLPQTADFMAAIISNEELERMNQYMIKQLKNRYLDKGVNKKGMIGVDYSKMRLFDVLKCAQENISESGNEKKTERRPFERVVRSFRGVKV